MIDSIKRSKPASFAQKSHRKSKSLPLINADERGSEKAKPLTTKDTRSTRKARSGQAVERKGTRLGSIISPVAYVIDWPRGSKARDSWRITPD